MIRSDAPRGRDPFRCGLSQSLHAVKGVGAVAGAEVPRNYGDVGDSLSQGKLDQEVGHVEVEQGCRRRRQHGGWKNVRTVDF